MIKVYETVVPFGISPYDVKGKARIDLCFD